MATNAPSEAKAYLTAATAENDRYKVKEIRPFSKFLASAAPAELAALVEACLIEPPRRGRSRRDFKDRALSFTDTDYMPPSPAQPPFLDLLEAARRPLIVDAGAAQTVDLYGDDQANYNQHRQQHRQRPGRARGKPAH